MLFGRVDDFAIEAMVEPGLQPPSAFWGRMRVWGQGVALGDFERERQRAPFALRRRPCGSH